MDEIDKYIETMVNKKITEPKGFEEAIRTALYSEKFNKRVKRKKILKNLSIFCLLCCISGCTVGGYIAYEKIWKEPEQCSYQEFQNLVSDTKVSEESKVNAKSAEEIKEKSMNLFKNLGYKNANVESIDLQETKQEGLEEIYYIVKAKENNINNFTLKYNATNGNLIYFEDSNILKLGNNGQEISEEKATEKIKEIYSKIKPEKNEYEFNKCNEETISYQGENKKVWVSNYYKKYEGIVNPYEEIKITFINENNNVKIGAINNTVNGKYENNPQVISEEEAIEIAKNKEKEYTGEDIINVDVKLGIRKMNDYFYQLDKIINKKETENTIGINKIKIRKVWLVDIRHTVKNSITDISKQYYIDITTGEIIGGNKLSIEG